jgi:hypothetical protein
LLTDSIEDNPEAFVRGGTIVRSPDIDTLLGRPAPLCAAHAMQPDIPTYP